MTTIVIPDELILLELDFEAEVPELCQVVFINEGRIENECGKLAVLSVTVKCDAGHSHSVNVCSDHLDQMISMAPGIACGRNGCKLPVIVVGSVKI